MVCRDQEGPARTELAADNHPYPEDAERPSVKSAANVAAIASAKYKPKELLYE